MAQFTCRILSAAELAGLKGERRGRWSPRCRATPDCWRATYGWREYLPRLQLSSKSRLR